MGIVEIYWNGKEEETQREEKRQQVLPLDEKVLINDYETSVLITPNIFWYLMFLSFVLLTLRF